MLTRLFKTQLIQLQLVPVFGYTELREHYMKMDEDIKNVILVGCGGMVDLESFLSNDDDDDPINRSVYILDTHRPWNLDNIFGSENIICFDDNTIDDELQNEKSAYQKLSQLLEEEDDEEEEDEEEKDEEEEDDEEEETEREEGDDNEEAISSSNDENSNSKTEDLGIEKDEGDQGEDESDPKLRKRSNKNDSGKTKKRKKMKGIIHQLEKTIQKYYTQGTTISNSLSVQIYSLVSLLGETDMDYLWLTIIGATSLDNTYPQVYNKLFPLLEDESKRLVTNTSAEMTKTPDTVKINIEQDYYLYLLRYSTLYNSFFYSNYVNAKLGLWNENGKRKLHKMFARMGISLIEAQKHWLYMNNDIKKELGNIFRNNLDIYGLQDIIRDAFIKIAGYRSSISAFEFVEGINALLEVGDSSGDVSSNANRDKTVDNDYLPIDEVLEKRSKQWISNFWESWDALDARDHMKLQNGINRAKLLQAIVFNTGVTILEKKLIKNLRIYRLCVLQDGPDLESYRNPLTLLRLGNWLLDCCAEGSDDRSLLPLVLAALDTTTDTYLCAGMAPKYPRGLALERTEPTLNNFSVAFQLVATEINAKVKIDNFESSILEIRRDDLSPFLEKLTLSGLL
ncbi:related to Cell division control protein 45 [Saccharomycodes ludwigii]|uniref:Related to Cell division control protein 45 n=1 Tax=Saccharomycodes ludwigii TaxID=36035 RepID=A0A376BAF2_9ASCO|nr:related to Cell division control protein 45 [Saccharomycodes ludwigii]